jgi:ATP-dependent exoDNAse (exonuclease V) alpha subunit
MSILDTFSNTEIVTSSFSIENVIKDVENTNKLLFVTGRAGTGKSTLLRKLCSTTSKKYAILAPTGIAAVNVGGETIHSFFHFKPGITYEEAKKYGDRNQNLLYEKLELLIIDEVSMVRADLLDCIDIFLRKARKKNEPFGGIQIVLFGDLYQLEPIVRAEERDALYMQYESAYFFSSWVFQELLHYPKQLIEFVELSTVHRQKDKEFINLLDKIRKKKADSTDMQYINARFREGLSDTLPDYIYLTTTNVSAARINNKNLELLFGEDYTFIGQIEGEVPENNLPTEWEIHLKLHARVMLLNNDPDKRWINGTLGYITKIDKEDIYVKLDNGEEHIISPYTWSYYKYFYNKTKQKVEKELVGAFTQYPIKLAWAITIHKSQGQTFERSVIWLEGRAFANGQVYVALSRCTTLEGVLLNRPIKPFDIMTDDKVKRFLIQIKKYIAHWRIPLEEKQKIMSHAIKEKERLVIQYLTLDDEQINVVVEPMQLKQDENGYLISAIVNSNMLKTLRLDQMLVIQKYTHTMLHT